MFRSLFLLCVAALIVTSCGGSSGGVSTAGDGESDPFPGAPVEGMGYVLNEQLPGTTVVVSYSESYDVATQIGGTVMVADSFSTDESFEVLNNLAF